MDLRTIGQASPADELPSRLVDPGARAHDAMWSIADCAVPAIAAIGPAIGAGLAFAACCDIIPLPAGRRPRVVARDQLMGTAMAMARILAAKSPIALRMAKASMNRVDGLPRRAAYRTAQDYTNRLAAFDDAAEARAAFFEKRDPEWKWR